MIERELVVPAIAQRHVLPNGKVWPRQDRPHHVVHFRPVNAFVRRAVKYRCRVSLVSGPYVENGKNFMAVLILLARRIEGGKVTLQCDGPDEVSAMEDLAAFIVDRMGGLPDELERTEGMMRRKPMKGYIAPPPKAPRDRVALRRQIRQAIDRENRQ